MSWHTHYCPVPFYLINRAFCFQSQISSSSSPYFKSLCVPYLFSFIISVFLPFPFLRKRAGICYYNALFLFPTTQMTDHHETWHGFCKCSSLGLLVTATRWATTCNCYFTHSTRWVSLRRGMLVLGSSTRT
jgi:hypothetical protein